LKNFPHLHISRDCSDLQYLGVMKVLRSRDRCAQLIFVSHTWTLHTGDYICIFLKLLWW